ncbi:MAG: hypothetical protein O7H41_20265 [Planctomycetota bacterium]|nr:hypothetical protein [Planctomycetota bacterium]
MARHELTNEERSKGGKKGSATLWKRHRESKEAELVAKTDDHLSPEEFLERHHREIAEMNPPPLVASCAKLIRDQEIARRYPPGVWVSGRREWRRRLAEMEGSDVTEADGEGDAA